MKTFAILATALGLTLSAPVMALAQHGGGEWSVTQVGGQSVQPGLKPTIHLDKVEGRVSGHSGCNRYSGAMSQDGISLRFSGMAGTMMACGPAQMQFERQMLQALGQVARGGLTAQGTLELQDANGRVVLRARR